MFDDPLRPVRPVQPIRAVRAIGLRRRPSGEQLGMARWFARKCAAKSHAGQATQETETSRGQSSPETRGRLV